MKSAMRRNVTKVKKEVWRKGFDVFAHHRFNVGSSGYFFKDISDKIIKETSQEQYPF